jgi:hypothetical protein
MLTLQLAMLRAGERTLSVPACVTAKLLCYK